jgi:hypothetical protein
VVFLASKVIPETAIYSATQERAVYHSTRCSVGFEVGMRRLRTSRIKHLYKLKIAKEI